MHNVVNTLQWAAAELPHEEILAASSKLNASLEKLAGAPEGLAQSVSKAVSSIGEAAAHMEASHAHINDYCQAVGNTALNGSDADQQPRPKIKPYTSPRAEYQKTYGFALFTDVNIRMLEAMEHEPLPRTPNGNTAVYLETPYRPGYIPGEPQRVPALALRRIAELAIRFIPETTQLRRLGGVTVKDAWRANQEGTFEEGFGDVDFTWKFAGCLASELAQVFVDEGVLTPEQRDAFTLTDWADMIGSGWFSKLVHVLAFAPNGVYGNVGSAPGDYLRKAIGNRLKATWQLAESDFPADGKIFDVRRRYEPHDGHTYITAELKPEVVHILRQSLIANGDSAGCPVARNATRLTRDQLKKDPHARRLVNTGQLIVVEGRSTETHVHVTQGYTAIDQTLMFFAAQLRQYEAQYGTPEMSYVTKDNETMLHVTTTHASREPVGLLRTTASPSNDTDIGKPHK